MSLEELREQVVSTDERMSKLDAMYNWMVAFADQQKDQVTQESDYINSNRAWNELPKFDGNHTRLYIKDCESFFDLFRIPDYQKVKMASLHMFGRAENWFYNMYIFDKGYVSWEEFIVDLLVRFRDDEFEHVEVNCNDVHHVFDEVTDPLLGNEVDEFVVTDVDEFVHVKSVLMQSNHKLPEDVCETSSLLEVASENATKFDIIEDSVSSDRILSSVVVSEVANDVLKVAIEPGKGRNPQLETEKVPTTIAPELSDESSKKEKLTGEAYELSKVQTGPQHQMQLLSTPQKINLENSRNRPLQLVSSQHVIVKEKSKESMEPMVQLLNSESLFEVIKFDSSHDWGDDVTALSFSTDGQPFLAFGGSAGVISIWNLEKKRSQSVIKEDHDSSIISLHFFANEPVLMSAFVDKTIKMWIFNTTDGESRLLRFRCGHSAPPQCIRCYANGRHILSVGQDRAFRLFSIVQDQQSRKLSQRLVSKRAKKLKLKEQEVKLKPVVAFDADEIRVRNWCNVVTCHSDNPQVYVWRLQNFFIGKHILTTCPDNQTTVKACVISACGHFADLGTTAGWIERFNLQSGISRGSYLDLSESGNYAHSGEVVGIACDSTNTLMVNAGYHGDIKVWNLKSYELKFRWEMESYVVATTSADLVIRLYDVVALRMVRKIEGHADRITDMCFNKDGKWFLPSSMDGTLTIWDVILARQIDAIQVDVSITALSLSPNMDILANTHVNNVNQNGVYWWANQAMSYGDSFVHSYGSRKELCKSINPGQIGNGYASVLDFHTSHSAVKIFDPGGADSSIRCWRVASISADA